MSRTNFANDVCQMIYELYVPEKDYSYFEAEKFIKFLKKVRDDYFEEYVRNIYECVDEIPLFKFIDYYDLDDPSDIYNEKYDEDPTGHVWTKEEILKDIAEECHEFYGNKMGVE